MSTKQEHITKRLEPYQEFSSGTLQMHEVLPALGEALQSVAVGPDIKVAEAALDCGGLELDECDEIELGNLLIEVLDTLQEYAPEYCYVGTHEGDGALYGVWPCVESVMDDIRFGEVLGVNDSGDIPSDYCGAVAVINERGNVEFGHAVNGEFTEIWSCV